MKKKITHSELREVLTQGIQKAVNNAIDTILKSDEPLIAVSRNGKIVYVIPEKILS